MREFENHYDSVFVEPEQQASEREAIIDHITDQNQLALDVWVSDPTHFQQLNVPTEALQAFIPRRVYEIADNPKKVSFIPSRDPSKYLLQGLIVEHKSNPVSNPNNLSVWLEAIKMKQSAEAELAETEGAKYRFCPPPAPDGIDDFHWQYYRLLTEGKLSMNDYVTTDVVFLGDYPPGALYVSEYNDRAELHRKGIGKSFYGNLRNVAKKMGFRFLTGYNNEHNLSFFTQTLGRSTLRQVKPEYRNNFHNESDVEKKGNCTIDFLYEEDKDYYLN